MKVLSLIFAFTLSAVVATAGGDNKKFIKTMETTIAMLDTVESPGSMMAVSNRFERIANAEQKEWLPLYYAAFCQIMISYMESDNEKKDEILDKAQALVDKANELEKKNSEIHILMGWIYSARIMVDPMTRGQKFGPQSSAMYTAAEQYDETNPRVDYMRGTSLFYTPPMWGGGKDKALPVLETAAEKYKNFKPKSSIHPTWGEKQTLEMIAQCNEE